MAVRYSCRRESLLPTRRRAAAPDAKGAEAPDYADQSQPGCRGLLRGDMRLPSDE
ncbi:hypothetical protein RHECNPAF_1760065 [Rhizobium etli CNPAF512]|nr:hypothetical protein RHECNPAF_1760065 [Rhizobium etli CNPAF512]